MGEVATHNSQPLGLRVGEDSCIRFARGVVVVIEGGMDVTIDSSAVGRGARIWHCAARIHMAGGGGGDEMTIEIRNVFFVRHMLLKSMHA